MTFLAVSDVSDLHEEMGWPGYQARVAFGASFDASVRGQIEAFVSAKVRHNLRLHECIVASMHRTLNLDANLSK